ncbi:MAG: cation-translocating P-type ATPase, partial [Nitrospirae bacterium]|nr:cation-translocating P-type ATPase [Nitrospirota bacterium]
RGTGIVVATGMDTELGGIAQMLQGEEEVKTPLQKRLLVFGKRISLAVLIICAVVFGAGIARGEPVLLMLLTAISLAVAAIPEALPAVVSIALALGARKMVRQNALIKKLPAVETLGSVTYICSDKTGTLTMNRMTAEEIYAAGKTRMTKDAWCKELGPGDPSDTRASGPCALLLRALALNNDSQEDASGNVLGDPTDIALYTLAKENGFQKRELEEEFPRVAEIPFDSERKCMTTFHAWAGGKGDETPVGLRSPGTVPFISFTKGAIDVLIEKAGAVLTPEGFRPIDREEIIRVNDRMAADGLRVLGVAMKEWDALPEDMSQENVESDLAVLCLVGIMDPPREEAAEAVSLCKTAGIRPVMITGDHPLTAEVIARRLGILERGAVGIMTGSELQTLSEGEFEKRVEDIRVYARVAPEQKLKIVKALQKRGQFVAMTGDGVNDAPALKRADIGIAMGVTGTDVAKEAAHMVLLDDNFATIVKAVKEGRKIYDNIRKFVKYLLTTNSGEIWTLFLAPFLGLPMPLLPIHILWINLMTDGLPALALSMEPAEGDVMQRKPRHPRESIFGHGLWVGAVWVGLLMAGIVLFIQAWLMRGDNGHWQTMVFTVLCLSQLGNVLAIRSERDSLFTIGLFSNRPLLGAVVVSFLFQMAVIYIPVLNRVFRTQPLSPGEMALALLFSSLVFFAVEIEKAWRRSRKA